MGELRLGEVALLREPGLIRLEHRRETHEAGPDERPQPDRQGDRDEEEVELEDPEDDHQAERDQARPEEPLVHVEVRGVAVEAPRPDVVDNDRGGQPEERRVEDAAAQVRKVVIRERQEGVLPWRDRHERSVLRNQGSARSEYAMDPGILGRNSDAGGRAGARPCLP